MRALQLIEAGRPLLERELPDPTATPGTVVVRIAAAGICRSDVHYRAGSPQVGPLPLTLGHEIAGTVATVGPGVDRWEAGERVAIHYQLSCGTCSWCLEGGEQFCPSGAMLGFGADGGYAAMIGVPDRNVFAVPDGVTLEHAAVMMCSSATCYHALSKARLQAGETVAVFGTGGLGMSAVQIAAARGAARVFAVDLNPAKLALAEQFGAEPVLAGDDPVAVIRGATDGRGVDVALELVGLEVTTSQAVAALAARGRAVAVGVGAHTVPVAPYADLIKREAELIGSADHLAHEIPLVLDLAARGRLDLTEVVSRTVPLDAGAVNDAMDELEAFGDAVRTVIVP